MSLGAAGADGQGLTIKALSSAKKASVSSSFYLRCTKQADRLHVEIVFKKALLYNATESASFSSSAEILAKLNSAHSATVVRSK